VTEIDGNKPNGAAALAGSAWLLGVLALLFLVLRVVGVIGWSWWWVLLPLWGPFALVTVIAIGALVGMVVHEVRKAKH